MEDKELAVKYQEWKKTPYFDFLIEESKKLRPDLNDIFIEQMVFKYYMEDIIMQPLKETTLKKPEPEDLIKVSCEVYDGEEDYKQKNPHIKEIHPKNVPEGEKVFEFLGIENPLPQELLENKQTERSQSE